MYSLDGITTSTSTLQLKKSKKRFPPTQRQHEPNPIPHNSVLPPHLNAAHSSAPPHHHSSDSSDSRASPAPPPHSSQDTYP